MPFPTVEHCIVCEEVRQELYRKATIIGFYGIVPNVAILVKDFGLAIDRLTFLLFTAPASGGEFTLGAEIVGPDGGRLTQIPPQRGPVAPGKRLALGFGIANLIFLKEGEHKFRLFVDERVQYEAPFRVEKVTDKDFQVPGR